MADTASLVARVKTEGVAQAAKQLDDFSASAAEAEGTAAAYARAQAKAAAEAKKSIPDLKGLSDATEQLGNKIAILEEAQTNGARSAAILAAQLKAGASASSEELNRIGDLTGRLYDMSNATKTVAANQHEFRKGAQRSGTQVQAVGYQVQDLVVQLQSGTSAFVAIGQQGSQLAGAFGPGGAVLGAVIALASAVGGVLYKSLGNAEIGTKELADAQKYLQIVLQQSENGAYKAADAFARLIRQGASAAVINAKVASAQQASNTELKSFQQIARDASKAGDTLWDGNAIGAASSLKTGAAVSSLNGYLDSFSKKMGISREEAKQLVPLLADVQRKADAKTIAALADQTDKLSKKYNNQNSELVKLNGSLQDGVQASVDNAAQQKALATIVEDTNKKQAASNDLYLRSLEVRAARGKEQAALERDLLKAQIKEKEGLTDAERQRANAAADRQYEAEIKKIDEQEKKKTDRENKSAMSAQKKIENEAARQQTAANNFLDTLARQNQDELKAIDAQEQQKLEKLQKFNEIGRIVGQQYEDAKTQIALDADAKRNELLEKQTEGRMKQQESADTLLEQIQAQNEGELGEFRRQQQKKLELLEEYHKKGRYTEQQFNDAKDAMVKESVIKQSLYSAQQFSNVFGDLSAAMKEGSKEAKAFAIMQAVVNTYASAVNAYMSASAIPFVGWIMGPVAAAAAVAAGLANVAKIRSAREQGGNLSVGQVSTIAERNKPEVIMPASASRVRTAEQMRQIMGENSSGNGVTGVTIVNNTSSQISSARTEQDDEGRLRVIISETVSQAMQDSNSDISRSRRSTRGQPGF